MSGISVFQSAPRTQFPGASRYQWRSWMPAIDAGSGVATDYFRSQVTGQGGLTRLSFNGTAQVSHVTDTVEQFMYTRFAAVGITQQALLVTDPYISAAYPLIPTGWVTPRYCEVVIHRMAIRWGAGVVSPTKGGMVGFMFGGANAAAYSYSDAWDNNSWIGLARTPAGIFTGYRGIAGPAVLEPLPSYDDSEFTLVESRLYPATATEYARYELRINQLLVRSISFATAGTPRYTAGTNFGVVPGWLQGCTAAPLPASFQFCAWELGCGPNVASTL